MEVKTIAVAILGGAFDHNELGDNDIACIPGALEELQEKHVTGSEDVQLDLIERSHFDRVTAERDALQLRLNAVEDENDRLRGHVLCLCAGANAEMHESWECTSYHPLLVRAVSDAEKALEKRP